VREGPFITLTQASVDHESEFMIGEQEGRE